MRDFSFRQIIKFFSKVIVSLGLCLVFSQPLYSQEFYWENPATFVSEEARFPKSVTNGKVSCVLWQEVDSKRHQIYISSAYFSDIDRPVKNERFAGPFKYSGEVPDIFSAAMNQDGTVVVALLSDINDISVYICRDGGDSYKTVSLADLSLPIVAPRIYVTNSGGYRIFTSLGENESFHILTSYSQTGDSWSEFETFIPSESLTNPFIPSLVSYAGGDLVVMQSQLTTGNRISYQLFATFSQDNGLSWSECKLLTDQNSFSVTETRPYTNFQNQQPTLYNMNGEAYLAWERTYYLSESASLWIARMNQSGLVSYSAEEITTSGNASRPVMFNYNGDLSIVWFDTRTGNESVYFSQKKGAYWNESALTNNSTRDMFAFPLLTNGGQKLSFVWELTTKKRHTISLLKPDSTVSKPRLSALSFREGKRATGKKVRIRVDLPDDSSGISGFSYVWGRNKAESPSYTITNLPRNNTLTLNADEDGDWYLSARVFDYAGNFSETATILYQLDMTPPKKPVITFDDTDKYGFARKNSFTVRFAPDEEDSDVEGYSFALDYVAPLPKNLVDNPHHPFKMSDENAALAIESVMTSNEKFLQGRISTPPKVMTKDTRVSFASRANGIYRFAVTAIDEVGNISECASILLILNKFIPTTYITSAKTSTNQLGEVFLSITGGGFTYDGFITKIFVDRDGEEPYDMVLSRSDGQYINTSDNRISNINLGNNMDEGNYRIGLLHSDRGLYWTKSIVRIEHNGTVKVEPEITFTPSWTVYENPYTRSVYVNYLLMAFIVILSAGITVFAIHGYISTAKEAAIIKKEVRALIFGGAMPKDKSAKQAALVKKGVSLKLKLIGFTAALVMAIVALVAVPLGLIMTTLQERTLSKGLQERVEVLMESLALGAKAYMPSNNILEMSYLPSQSDSMIEVKYATIMGEAGEGNGAGLNYVWATNDPKIDGKIDSDTLNFGVSRMLRLTSGDEVMISEVLEADLVAEITENCRVLNQNAAEQIGSVATSIAELNAEGVQLALKTDDASIARLTEIGEVTTQLNGQLISSLNEISKNGISTYPKFDASYLDRTNTDYLFYKPVMYRQGNTQNYVHGVILVEVTTETLIQEADRSRYTVLFTSAVIAAIAMLIGAILSLIMATIIVNPIKQLASHVQVIGDTRDKSKLKGKDIPIKSRDEIGQLGQIVNVMTQELAKAAEDEKLSLDGKAVQNAFLPLLAGKEKTETVAKLNDSKVECFGYYEGASGVSGDYFDYRKLDDRWYVFIKCDASGHGVPAALIMTVAATMFREYFNSWSYAKNGVQLNLLVTKINDAIESLSLKGKFAAMIICLFDSSNGDVYMCNAGDNIVHIFDQASGKQKVLTLSETPAAGPLPSFMVDMKGGFKVEKSRLNKGDVLFLYTDGIEESTRLCRLADFSVIQNQTTDKDGNIAYEAKKELMEPERVQAVIEAVFAKSSFVLQKEDNPVPGEFLSFDFSNCEGTLEEVILALASVEKVFRLYKLPKSGEGDVVVVDRRIDDFLSKHFNLYSYYCANKRETEEQNYMEYTNVLEDEQLDDLTLLAVRRL